MTTTAGEPVRPATATGPRRATADTPYPEVALLSNGSYGVLITAAGAGVGTWRDLDVSDLWGLKPRGFAARRRLWKTSARH
jgi:hypothetical protein